MAKLSASDSEQDLVRLYLDGIGQYPLLTQDDEVRLLSAADFSARREVARASDHFIAAEPLDRGFHHSEDGGVVFDDDNSARGRD